LKIRGTGDELDRLSETFNHLLDRIGSYLQDRRDFLANAAHELRTPLAAIRSGIDVTLVKPRSSDEYQNLLTDIGAEATALSQLVNQLLLLSETESERLREHAERVRLDELIDKAKDMFEGVAESKYISLDVSQSRPTEVLGNPHHLRQVIYNLLDNALKFTPPGGRIAIELEHDHKEAVVTFQDSGIGIPEDDLQRVFERFYQIDRRRQLQLDEASATATTEATATANTPATTDADATTAGDPTIDEAPRGTGLGLSICRAIVLAHKGTIRAMSQPSQGTRFVVRLPLATAAGEASSTR
jgi:signal transduction histidine kinase